MHAITERWITLRLVRFEGTEGCERALSGFSARADSLDVAVDVGARRQQPSCLDRPQGERQRAERCAAQVNVEVLRDEEILTTVGSPKSLP